MLQLKSLLSDVKEMGTKRTVNATLPGILLGAGVLDRRRIACEQGVHCTSRPLGIREQAVRV